MQSLKIKRLFPHNFEKKLFTCIGNVSEKNMVQNAGLRFVKLAV